MSTGSLGRRKGSVLKNLGVPASSVIGVNRGYHAGQKRGRRTEIRRTEERHSSTSARGGQRGATQPFARLTRPGVSRSAATTPPWHCGHREPLGGLVWPRWR